jgi:hypothetical protein
MFHKTFVLHTSILFGILGCARDRDRNFLLFFICGQLYVHSAPEYTCLQSEPFVYLNATEQFYNLFLVSRQPLKIQRFPWVPRAITLRKSELFADSVFVHSVWFSNRFPTTGTVEKWQSLADTCHVEGTMHLHGYKYLSLLRFPQTIIRLNAIK